MRYTVIAESTEQHFTDLVEEFRGGLTRLAASYEPLPQAREDLLQDIYMALWVALPKWRGEASLRTLVYRIAHNRALTHVWKRKRRGTPETIDDVTLPDDTPGPEQTAIAAADRDRLVDVVRALPLALRQPMLLALEDLSHSEMSAVLGITENNVAVRLSRARALLRERMMRS
ncbi:MAG TPA: sigma-70 family RNA polymerase sigma factor [Candidatus Tumulicola sp.]